VYTWLIFLKYTFLCHRPMSFFNTNVGLCYYEVMKLSVCI